MKTPIILIASILFSLLFFKYHIGLNIVLFAILTNVVLAVLNPKKYKEKNTLIKAFLLIVSGFFFFKQPSVLTIFTYFISFVLLVGSVSESKSAIYIKLINGLYSIIVASFANHFDRVKNEVKAIENQKINYGFWLRIIGIPILVLSLFIGLYKDSNPVFNNLVSQINFSFINIQWLLFTAMGYYLFHNIANPIIIEPATKTDLETPNFLIKENLNVTNDEKLKTENQLGTVLIILLNTLISVVLFTDYLYLNSDLNTDNPMAYSKNVHSGIYALIFSIITAIGLIIYFFRGNLNFYNKNKTLKIATYIWIALNILLVFSTALKNHSYIATFGYTYKRIGVSVYLLLVFIGLIFTFIKVYSIKNIVFLFRKNLQVAFAILILTSAINWDNFITNYNLTKVRNGLDVEYLLRLNNNATILKKYKDKHINTKNDAINFNRYPKRIDDKYNWYLVDLENNSWQEKIYANFLK
ncbi:MAG: DUF4173 domain-containing protein [Flavobacteriaceae bacterium]